MKLVGYSKIIMLTLILSSSIAQAMEYDSPYTAASLEGTKPGECIIEPRFEIVGAIDSHHYEIAAAYEGVIVAHGILETTVSTFSTTGNFDIRIRYKGVKVMKLANGFTAKFGVWQECK